jgi:hypothetical protein
MDMGVSPFPDVRVKLRVKARRSLTPRRTDSLDAFHRCDSSVGAPARSGARCSAHSPPAGTDGVPATSTVRLAKVLMRRYGSPP